MEVEWILLTCRGCDELFEAPDNPVTVKERLCDRCADYRVSEPEES